jgi:carbon-monoxide dehydrogenase large subunit
MPRLEDPALLRGQGQYTDDLSLPGQLAMVVVRAPIAHGRLRNLDCRTAAELAGVVTILTASDLQQHGVKPLNCRASLTGSDGQAMLEPDRPVLTDDKIVHLGQPLAAVIAESEAIAQQAAELIEMDYETLPAITNPQQAIADTAPQIWPQIPGNRSFIWEKGNREETDAAMAAADHIIELTVEHPRIAITPVEPRACLAAYDTDSSSYTLITPSQGVISLQRALAGFLAIEQDRLRVITHDTGGSFAVKIWPYPEQVLALIGARVSSRPVKWTATRSESFQADAMGRGRVDKAQLALDKNGRFLGFRIEALADMGAFLNAVGPYVASSGAVRPFGQTYNIPAMHYSVDALFTNCIPTDAYRGAGKPESATTLERLIELAAQRLDIDPFELRRQNLIQPADLPFDTPMAETYDGGDFPQLADQLHQKADWAGLAQRKTQSLQNGLLRGAGVAFYLHATGGSTDERSEVHAQADGTVLVRTGLQDNGQGHKTVLATVASEALDIPIERITVEQGDTEWLKKGGGTGGSNLVPVAANTVHRAALEMIENGKQIAAHLLEASHLDIEYNGGEFRIVGTDRSATLAKVAESYQQAASDLREQMPETGCAGILDFEGTHTTFPNGGCVVEVEVDPQTGQVHIDRYCSIDDVGRVYDEQSALGQLHGGIAQAAGEILYEDVHYDEHGQLLSGSMMDYTLPRATDLPGLHAEFLPTASPNSLLGAKGVGELTSIGVPGPIMNAVMDALRPHGIDHIDRPMTANKIWQALALTTPASVRS